MNEIVGDAIDVGVNHEGINEAHDQHDPERRIRKKEIHRQEVEEVKQAGQRGHDVPSRVRKNLRISFRAFDMDGISHVHPTSQVCATRLQKQPCAFARRAAFNESGTIRGAFPDQNRINSSRSARGTSAHSELGKACSGGNSRSESLALSCWRGERCFTLATQLKAAGRAEKAGNLGNY